MFPKLYWDTNGVERALVDAEQEAIAITEGWSPVPPGLTPAAPVAPVAPAAKPTGVKGRKVH